MWCWKSGGFICVRMHVRQRKSLCVHVRLYLFESVITGMEKLLWGFTNLFVCVVRIPPEVSHATSLQCSEDNS